MSRPHHSCSSSRWSRRAEPASFRANVKDAVTRFAQETSENGQGSTARDSVAVVPLAIPILAGPGAISTVIVYAHRSASFSHQMLICAIIIVVAASAFVVLRFAPIMASLAGRTGMRVFTQIMGLIVAAIAVEFITQGLAAIFPGWQAQ
jgi:multiple antibiotic resistance protein